MATAMVNHDHQNGRHSDLDFKLTIRSMQFDEIEPAVMIFSRADLNDSLNVVQSYYESDPSGFFVAIDEDSDKVIGACAAPMTTHHTRFLGLYCVEPQFQGLGIGMKLFSKCMEQVGDDNCGLCAVPSKFKIYKDRAGFRQQEGRSMVIIEGKSPNIQSLRTAEKLDQRYRLIKLMADNIDRYESLIEKIIEFDETVQLDNRSKLLRHMFVKTTTITLAVLDTMTNDNKIVGYGCIQLDPIGRSMPGPLYAIDPLIGEILLSELIRSDGRFSSNDQIAYFTTDNSPETIRWSLELLGLNESCRCEKLYTKFIPPFNYNHLYCCHSPDFAC